MTKKLEVIIDLKKDEVKLESRKVKIRRPYNITISSSADSEKTDVRIEFIPKEISIAEYSRLNADCNEIEMNVKKLFEGTPINISYGTRGAAREIILKLPSHYYGLKLKRAQ